MILAGIQHDIKDRTAGRSKCFFYFIQVQRSNLILRDDTNSGRMQTGCADLFRKFFETPGPHNIIGKFNFRSIFTDCQSFHVGLPF